MLKIISITILVNHADWTRPEFCSRPKLEKHIRADKMIFTDFKNIRHRECIRNNKTV